MRLSRNHVSSEQGHGLRFVPESERGGGLDAMRNNLRKHSISIFDPTAAQHSNPHHERKVLAERDASSMAWARDRTRFGCCRACACRLPLN